MRSVGIRHALAALLVVLALAALGCSSTTTRPDPIPEFTQQEADDVAQMLGATVALDLGGWMVEIQNALETRRAEGDTTDLVPGPITHTISYHFTKSGGALNAVWDTSVVSVEVHDKGVGSFTGGAGILGPHFHESDVSIFSANEDTMYFNTLAVDTSLFAMKSFNRADSVYYHLDNFFDYDELRLHKDQLTPWPIDGTASWLVDATKLSGRGGTPTRSILVEMLITFDGSQFPEAVVFEDIGDASTTFNYTVDLKTGTVARAP